MPNTLNLIKEFNTALQSMPFERWVNPFVVLSNKAGPSEQSRSELKPVGLLRQNIGRTGQTSKLVHCYNESGYDLCSLIFRFDADEKAEAKLEKVYGIASYNREAETYHKAGELAMGEKPAMLFIRYDQYESYVEVRIDGYRKKYDALAIEKMREVLCELEKVLRT